MDLTRRSLLGASLAGVASSFSPLSLARAIDQLPNRPKNIIFMVADGMADQVPNMADYYQQLVYGNRSYWASLLEKPYAQFALQETRSLNSVVTDSSAAASTWGCGRRIWNGMINTFPDTTELIPIAKSVQDKGMKTGLVTTTTLTHATPSGFSIMNLQRDVEAMIAEQHLKTNIDIMLGGGDRYFSAKDRKDKKDLYADFAKKGYKILRTRDQLLSNTSSKVLGVFSSSHLPYSVDRNHSDSLSKSTPTLAEMAKAAINQLKGSPNGFLLQIEGGRVDHGAHGNDLAATMFDMIAFEEAMKVAIDFALEDKETLVIVTSDHATGGPSLNGDGSEYIDSTAGLLRTQRMTCSFSGLTEAFGTKPSPSRVREVIRDKYGISLSLVEGQAISGAFDKNSPLNSARFYGSSGATMAAILGNYSKVTWTSGNHTSDHVWVTAVGPGSELIKGIVPNVKFHSIMLGLLDIKFENPPQMNFEDAQRQYEILKAKKATAFAEAIAWYSDETEPNYA